jgi:hypothetical protein
MVVSRSVSVLVLLGIGWYTGYWCSVAVGGILKKFAPHRFLIKSQDKIKRAVLYICVLMLRLMGDGNSRMVSGSLGLMVSGNNQHLGLETGQLKIDSLFGWLC